MDACWLIVNGPGSVILIVRSVCARRNAQVVDLDRAGAPDRSDDARHRVRAAGAAGDHRRVVDVEPLERGREAVGVALAADLAVGDDVDAGALEVADGERGGVVLGLGEVGLRDAP